MSGRSLSRSPSPSCRVRRRLHEAIPREEDVQMEDRSRATSSTAGYEAFWASQTPRVAVEATDELRQHAAAIVSQTVAISAASFVGSMELFPENLTGSAHHRLVEAWSPHCDIHDVSIMMLNRWFSYVGAFDTALAGRQAARPPTGIRSAVTIFPSEAIGILAGGYQHFTIPHLQNIAHRHGMRFARGLRKPDIVQRLHTHICSSTCVVSFYVFVPLPRERSSVRIRNAISSNAVGNPGNPGNPEITSSTQMDVAGLRSRHEMPFSVAPLVQFPEQYTTALRDKIIFEWQVAMEPRSWICRSCASCGQMKFLEDLCDHELTDSELDLLCDEDLAEHLYPVSYNFHSYRRALLHPGAMTNRTHRDRVTVCQTCVHSLSGGRTPVESIANKMYYAHERLSQEVASAFERASMNDLQYVSACRMTRIVYIVDNPNKVPGQLQQRINKGHCATIPQDFASMARCIPASAEDMSLGMCVIFVGQRTEVTMESIRQSLHPLLISIPRVRTLAHFLVDHNPTYRELGIVYSGSNLQGIAESGSWNETRTVGVPATVTIDYVANESGAAAQAAATTRYAPSMRQDLIIPSGELLLEHVSYGSDSQSCATSVASKALALRWCMEHKPFVRVTDGGQLLSDRDPRMMTCAFPHLDPWGIGGFGNQTRKHGLSLSMEHQLKCLLLREASPFSRDAQFAYTTFNAIQRMQTLQNATFRVKDHQFADVASNLLQAKDKLVEMETRYRLDPNATPKDRTEQRIINAINQIRIMCKDVMGSNGSKARLRTKARAMLKSFGCPALFTTLNPSDMQSLQLHVMCGGDPNEWPRMDAWQRAKQVVDHPAEAAIWFDRMINLFIKHVLRYGAHEPGLFGTCEAYFGTVEAQGRGSLHCHMLLWLHGNLSPQDVRDRMQEDAVFKQTMFGWLECIVKCELPGMTDVLQQGADGERLRRPAFEDGTDPRLLQPPLIPDPETMGPEERAAFEISFQQFVKELAIACNWHEHSATCWKYLKDGEPRTDDKCRMRMTGETRSITELDKDTGSILLRRLHPWINNFNDVVLFLLRSNMDLKYIGSGPAAKALVYYITNYITKNSLPMHVGIGAVLAAMKKMENMPVDDGDGSHHRRMFLIKCVNAMIGRLEISHQQVMSFIVGGGDHYTSHNYSSLYWGDMHNFHPKTTTADDASVSDQTSNEDPGFEYSINISDHNITGSNILVDYRNRPDIPEFNKLSPWDYACTVEKLTATRGSRRARANHRRTGDDEDEDIIDTLTERHACFLPEHPQATTHVVRFRRIPRVPILSGPKISRSDDGDMRREDYSRAMMILLTPWRSDTDLNDGTMSWTERYEQLSLPLHLR